MSAIGGAGMTRLTGAQLDAGAGVSGGVIRPPVDKDAFIPDAGLFQAHLSATDPA